MEAVRDDVTEELPGCPAGKELIMGRALCTWLAWNRRDDGDEVSR